MISYTRVTTENLKELYNNTEGNLYYRISDFPPSIYDVVDGFDYEELLEGLVSGECELIYIAGPSLGINVKIEED